MSEIKIQSRTDIEIEENWNKKWKEILQNEDGSINLEKLKLELMDFEDLIDKMISLTCKITRGRMSYATYPLETILQVAEEEKLEEIKEQRKDDIEDGYCSLCERDFEEEKVE